MTPPIDIENLNVPQDEIPPKKATKSLWVICLSLLLAAVTALFTYLMISKKNELKGKDELIKRLTEDLATERTAHRQDNEENAIKIDKKDSTIFALQEGKYKSILDVVNVRDAKTKIEIQNPEVK